MPLPDFDTLAPVQSKSALPDFDSLKPYVPSAPRFDPSKIQLDPYQDYYKKTGLTEPASENFQSWQSRQPPEKSALGPATGIGALTGLDRAKYFIQTKLEKVFPGMAEKGSPSPASVVGGAAMVAPLGLPETLGKLLLGYFAYRTAAAQPDIYRQIKSEIQSGNYSEALRTAVEDLLQMGMIGTGAAGSRKPAPQFQGPLATGEVLQRPPGAIPEPPPDLGPIPGVPTHGIPTPSIPDPSYPKNRPVVPGTAAEPRETAVETIRRAQATTKEQIQQLFPKANLSRQKAAQLRDLAWGKPSTLNPQPSTPTPNARQIQTSATVHGDLRPQPISGPGQVPLPESGPGIQPQAQGRLLQTPPREVPLTPVPPTPSPGGEGRGAGGPPPPTFPDEKQWLYGKSADELSDKDLRSEWKRLGGSPNKVKAAKTRAGLLAGVRGSIAFAQKQNAAPDDFSKPAWAKESESAQPSVPSVALVPALLVNDKPITGGKNHIEIRDTLTKGSDEQADAAFTAFAQDKNHVFLDENQNVLTREQAGARIGKEKLHSGDLETLPKPLTADEVLARPPGSVSALEIAVMPGKELLDLMQRRGGPKNELLYPPQRDAVVWGMKQPKSALPALERMSKEAVRTNQASLEKTGQMDMAAQAREFWYNGAIQGLREEGGAGGNVAQVKAETLAKMRPTTGIAETTPLAASIGPGAASPADSAFTKTKQDRFAGKIAVSSKEKTDPAVSPPVSNPANGGLSPPPPNSLFSPDTAPGAEPAPTYARRLVDSFSRWWEKFWPRDLAVIRTVPDSPVITEHQRLIKNDTDYLLNFSKQPWWKTLQGREEAELIDLENQAVKAFRANLAAGDEPVVAYRKALDAMPDDFKNLLQQRDRRIPVEIKAADILAVDRPSLTDDPYVARLTNEAGKDVVDLHPQIANWGRQIRTTIGSFDQSRTHPTMKDGLAAGTQYDPMLRAVWLRELASARLEATANLLQNLKGKVLFDTPKEALAASPTKQIARVRGLGGKDYWARTRQEAIFLEQNLNTTQRGPLGRIQQLANTYIRNPSLINPLPHTTKNMLFKYLLARVGNLRFKSDVRDFAAASPAALKERFDKVMPMTEHGERTPQITAREVGTWGEKLASRGLRINNPSTRFIFGKADPAMRYSLWKSYVRKGLGDQEAANHVWLDLIRYDANSGGINFWKSIPFNFFVPWRTGSYVTLAKQFRAHPVRALLFIGAVEYLRELRYRKTGRWTHLPTDYLDAPLAEAIQSPRTVPAVAATSLLFGPGGGQAPNTIKDFMASIQGDPQNKARVMNMFWGLSQLYNIPREFEAYRQDGQNRHLVNILTSAAISEHAALKYQPRRLMQWLPEWMPGLEKSALVKQAELLQAKIAVKQQKGEATYETRHSVSRTFDVSPEAQQLEELERATGQIKSTTSPLTRRAAPWAVQGP